jgi:hypothetical protein
MNKEFFIERSNNIGSLTFFLSRPVNIEYLDYLNSNIPRSIIDRQISEKVYYFLNNIENVLLCKCNEHLKFIGFKNGYRVTCGGKDCYVKSRKETCLEKYGVDNPKKSIEVLEKEQLNILNKYNGKHYMMDESIKNKMKNTMLDKYGVEYAQQSKSIKDKSISTWNTNVNKYEICKNRSIKMTSKSTEEKEIIKNKKILSIENKFGTYDNFINYRQEKIKEASYKKWNVSHHLMNESIISKRVDSYKKTIDEKIVSLLSKNLSYINREFNVNKTDQYILLSCSKCSTEFNITRQLLYNRSKTNKEICLICNPVSNGTSDMEQNLFKFISDSYNGEIIQNSKSIIKGELDIYLPEINLAFEFNGLYWHSNIYKDKYYHINKTNECKEKNIQLIHIWEDDWVFKQDIIKSIILNKLNIIDMSNESYVIRENINSDLVVNFINNNYINGFVEYDTTIGLFNNEELVSIITYTHKIDHYEITSICNKLYMNIDLSLLFDCFVKNCDNINIIGYNDVSLCDGSIFENLGFVLCEVMEPNFYSIVGCNRIPCEDDKSTGIYDCGIQKWVFSKHIKKKENE